MHYLVLFGIARALGLAIGHLPLVQDPLYFGHYVSFFDQFRGRCGIHLSIKVFLKIVHGFSPHLYWSFSRHPCGCKFLILLDKWSSYRFQFEFLSRLRMNQLHEICADLLKIVLHVVLHASHVSNAGLIPGLSFMFTTQKSIRSSAILRMFWFNFQHRRNQFPTVL